MPLQLSAADRSAVAYFLARGRLIPERGSPQQRLALTYQAFRPVIYENLSKILRRAKFPEGDPRVLETPSVLLPKHLESGFGGTCYSLAYSLAALLEAMGLPVYLTLNDLGGHRHNHAAVVALVGDTTWLCDPGVQFAEPVAFSPTRERTGDNEWSLVRVKPEGAGIYNVANEIAGEDRGGFKLDSRPVPEEEFRAVWLASFGGPLMNTFHIFRHCTTHARHLCFGERRDQIPGQERMKRRVEESRILEEVREVWPSIPEGHAESAIEVLRARGVGPVWAPPPVVAPPD